VVKIYNQPTAIANLIANDLLRELSEAHLGVGKKITSPSRRSSWRNWWN
jgi:hypothetical protein